MVDFCEYGKWTFGFHKTREYLEQLSNYQLLKEGSARYSGDVLKTRILKELAIISYILHGKNMLWGHRAYPPVSAILQRVQTVLQIASQNVSFVLQ
jgi:hypothetical protein